MLALPPWAWYEAALSTSSLLMSRFPSSKQLAVPGCLSMSTAFSLASLTTQTYHVLLTQGLLYGIRNSLLCFPLISVTPKHFGLKPSGLRLMRLIMALSTLSEDVERLLGRQLVGGSGQGPYSFFVSSSSKMARYSQARRYVLWVWGTMMRLTRKDGSERLEDVDRTRMIGSG